MKTASYYRDQYRVRAGKEPMLKVHRNSSKQTSFIQRSKLIEFFKESVNETNGTTYFTHPDDIKDVEKENTKINVILKPFFSRCDNDLDKAKEVIQFFSGEYGSWCNWKPSVCFRRETVQDYENRDKGNKGDKKMTEDEIYEALKSIR